MLKLELLALATKSCNFYVAPFFSYHWPSLLQLWQKLDQKAAPPAESEENPSGSLQRTVTESRWWVLLSASWFRNSWKLPRCQPISSHLYEEQAQHLLFLVIPAVARELSKSPGSLGVVSAGVVNPSCKTSAQSCISLNRVETSTAETSLLRNPDLCHPRDFREQGILWLLNIMILLPLHCQKHWMLLNAGRFKCCWNLGDQNAAHHS